MKALIIILIFSFSSMSFAKKFDNSAATSKAAEKANLIVKSAEKKCTLNRRIFTACLKNLQLQAIEKKIGVLEQTLTLVVKIAKPGKAKTAWIKKLQKEIKNEAEFLEFYNDRAFDGPEALELDLKYLLVKQALLDHLKANTKA